jgi:hypothetical protein
LEENRRDGDFLYSWLLTAFPGRGRGGVVISVVLAIIVSFATGSIPLNGVGIFSRSGTECINKKAAD